jgi:NAD+ synthase (glutamine-hydrolysing)
MELVICQINTIVGDFEGNAKKIIALAKKIESNKILIFPELTISSYPVLDLANNSSFVQEQLEYLDFILKETAELSSFIILGYIEINKGPGKSLFNSAAVCYKGQIIYNYLRK